MNITSRQININTCLVKEDNSNSITLYFVYVELSTPWRKSLCR